MKVSEFKLFFIVFILLFILISVLVFKIIQKTSLNSFRPRNQCREINRQEIISYIPIPKENSSHFFFKHYGYSPDKCHYALLVAMKPNYSNDEEKYLNVLMGNWIIDISKGKAELFESKCKPQEGVYYGHGTFYRWINNAELEFIKLNTFSSVININTCELLSKRLINIGFGFPKTSWKYPIKFKSQTDKSECNVTLQKPENIALVYYPFFCIEKSDISINAQGYEEIDIQFVNKDSIKVNGILYDNLIEKKGWVTIN